jgi:hypothetical protein
MSANDAGASKIAMQAFNLRETGHLDVNDGYLGTLNDDDVAKFFHGACGVNGSEVMTEGSGQGPGSPGVALEESNAERLHTTPMLAVVYGGPELRPEAADIALTSGDDVDRRLLSGWRLLGQGLKRFSPEFPVVLEQDFHLAFGLLQLFTAGVGELHAFLKKSEGLL